MAGRKLTPEVWEFLVDGFRKWPGKWTKVARAAGVHHSTAKRAWLSGLVSHTFGQVPIAKILEDEKTKTRAALNDLGDLDLIEDSTRARSISIRIAEGKLTELARTGVIETLTALKETNRGIRMLNIRIGAELERVSSTAKRKIDLKAALNHLRNYSHIMLNVAHAAGSVIDMENKLTGSGDLVDEDDWTLEECAEEIAEANATMERLQAKGKLKIINGGKA